MNDDVARNSRGRGKSGATHRNDVPGSQGQGARSGRPATGQRSASAPRSASTTTTRTSGNKAVWSSNTGGTSGGSFGSGNSGRGGSGSGRPARSGPRRASAPASNERRSR